MDALEPHLSLLKAMGSGALVLCETTNAVHGDRNCSLSKRPVMNEAQWKRLTEGLERLGAHTAKRGIRLAYHPHMGTVVQTAQEIDQRCDRNVWLLLDTGHVTYAGDDPVAVTQKHAARVAHVHTKDVRPGVLEASLQQDAPFLKAVLDGVFTVPGDGSINFRGVFGALAETKYDGWLVVEAEQDPRKAHPLTYATMGFQNLSVLTREVGLGRPARV
jgi:inosose dehydratase